jgi:hypothetical protein
MMGGDITGEIHLFTDTTDGCPPWNDASTLSARMASNFALPTTRLTIYDLRGKEKSVDLDINGFELANYEGLINNEFDEGSEAQRIYYDEISSFLKKRLGASRVVIFNYIFRCRGPLRPNNQCDVNHKNPVLNPHVDFDPLAAQQKMEELLGEDESKKRMQNRFQLINIWRSIGPNAITNKPLTICDYSTLDIENDVHPITVRGSSNAVTAYTVSCKIPDSQRWYYLSEMRSNEMFVVKMFDSKPEVAQYGFHTAFINEHVPPSDVDQKSIELRCLVLYDE